ncbi:MAG TPA: nucleotidyltransferase family protein [Thermoanaerobaculia bacterium]
MSRETYAPLCETLPRWLAEPPAEPPDWPAECWALWRETAQVHGVAPILWLRLRDRDAWADSREGAWLADQHDWNGRRVARLHGELAEVLRLFAAEGVPILPVKGAVLGALRYEDAAARPMADLDLLLREEHSAAGEALFARLGYAKTFTGWKHARFSRPGSDRIVDREREHPDNPRQLEVHPRCRERLRDDVIDLTDAMWSAARPGTLLGEATLLPGDDVHWLYLLVHATHHVLQGNCRLLQLCDLERLAGRLSDPEPLLASVDARATYPAQALLERYAPSERGAALRAVQRERLPAAYAEWADGLDLFEVCHLHEAPWRDA